MGLVYRQLTGIGGGPVPVVDSGCGDRLVGDVVVVLEGFLGEDLLDPGGEGVGVLTKDDRELKRARSIAIKQMTFVNSSPRSPGETIA